MRIIKRDARQCDECGVSSKLTPIHEYRLETVVAAPIAGQVIGSFCDVCYIMFTREAIK